jgi:DNA-binding NarL/FixJ family response regulator
MRIILADHHAGPLSALKEALQAQPGFDLIGETVDAQGLLMLAGENTADLVLLDSELPGSYVEDLITGLHAIEPKPVVIVMSCKFEKSRMLLKAGADAYVSKSDQFDWLLEILQKYEKRTNNPIE